MHTVKGILSIVQDKTEELCGRLIVWDIGTPRENNVVLAQYYHHVHYTLSPEIELKPYVPSEKDQEVVDWSVAAINKVLKRLNLDQKSSQKSSQKKPWLN